MLADGTAVEIIDRIAAYLENELDEPLPDHKLVKYRRPLLVVPEDCPLLNVWLLNQTIRPKTTNRWDSMLNVGVVWWQEQAEQIQTLVDDAEWAKSLVNATEVIQDGLALLAAGGGWDVAHAPEILPVSTQWTPPADIAAGLVEGYAVTVSVRVVKRRLRDR